MSAQILSVFSRRAVQRDWSAQDIAEFYRVESALIQAGLRVTSDRGLTDEGDPWFVFCRVEDDEVIIHFARIDGRYVISAPSYCGTAAGSDFRALVRSTIERHPVLRPRPVGDNLFLHPSALLVMLVASALLQSGHPAEASPIKPAPAANGVALKQRGITVVAMNAAPAVDASIQTQHETLLLLAINAVLAASVPAEMPVLVVSASASIPAVLDAQPVAPVDDHSFLAETQGVPFQGDVTPVTAFQPVATLPLDAFTHIPSPPVTQVFLLSATDSTGAPVAPTGSPPALIAPPVIDFPVMTASAAASTHSLVFPVSGLPPAEQDVLHALGVTSQVVQVDTPLPTSLSFAVHTGTHATIHTVTYTTQDGDHGALMPPSPPAPAGGAVTPEAVPGDVAAPSPPAATQAAPSAAPVPSHPAPPLPVESSGFSDLSAVLATVEEFRAIVAHSAVVITDHSVILYDASAINANLSTVTSITYELSDGSSVSLVGLPSELAHAGAHM